MKNRYDIYNCVAKRNDDTKIIRIFKIQSHFLPEDLAMALLTTSDSPRDVKRILVENDGDENSIDFQNLVYGGITLDELEDSNIKVTFIYKDNTVLEYECKREGVDVVSKPITRTTPYILAASGMSRFTHEEYLKKEKNYMYDRYYHIEDERVNLAMKELQHMYNLYRENYFA